MSKKKKPKFYHDPIPGAIFERLLDDIRPTPENEKLYRPVSADDPEVIAIVKSIGILGVIEPIVISRDGYIISGHRRHMAARLADLSTVPCRVENVRRSDPGFLELLREYNRQRVKTLDEITREEVISANPEEAHRLLVGTSAPAGPC